VQEKRKETERTTWRKRLIVNKLQKLSQGDEVTKGTMENERGFKIRVVEDYEIFDWLS
jgi:hypothetical protein